MDPPRPRTRVALLAIAAMSLAVPLAAVDIAIDIDSFITERATADQRRHAAQLIKMELAGRVDGAARIERYRMPNVEPLLDFLMPPMRGQNVVWVLPATTRTDRNIIIGAHYDSEPGSPGADDNASGVAALLTIAETLSRLPQRTKRSVLLAFWDGEENGLLGSKHWAAQPTVDLRQVVLGMNVDMIGRLQDEKLQVYGARTAAHLRTLIARHNRGFLELDFPWEMKDNSDHHSLFQRQVPVLMLHTGLHGDYHRPSDDPETLNYDGMRQVTQLLLESVLEVADAPQRPAFRPRSQSENESLRQRYEQPLAAPPPRLGVRWQVDSRPGLPLTGVVINSPAHLAGLRAGDRLLKFNGEVIRSEAQMLRAVLRAPADSQLTVRQRGQSQPLEVRVTLAGRPVRWGLSWRADPAHRGVLIVVQVVPHSPAADAGLAVGDRIYQAEGEPAESERVMQLMQETARGQSVRLLLERRGRLMEAALEEVGDDP